MRRCCSLVLCYSMLPCYYNHLVMLSKVQGPTAFLSERKLCYFIWEVFTAHKEFDKEYKIFVFFCSIIRYHWHCPACYMFIL